MDILVMLKLHLVVNYIWKEFTSIYILTVILAIVVYEVSLKVAVPQWSHNIRIILFPYTKYPMVYCNVN